MLDFSADSAGEVDIWFLTSSKKHDPQIKEILGEEEGEPCRCVPNMIRL